MSDEKFYQALRDAGHVLQLRDDGRVDNWALDYEFHNGPACVTCHSSWCEHCGDKIEPCSKPALDAEFVNITNQKKLT